MSSPPCNRHGLKTKNDILLSGEHFLSLANHPTMKVLSPNLCELRTQFFFCKFYLSLRLIKYISTEESYESLSVPPLIVVDCNEFFILKERKREMSLDKGFGSPYTT